jgi:hypothetical protein
MELIITAITISVVLYVLIKVSNSQLATTLSEAGTEIISINAKESVFDSRQRLGGKLIKAKESGKAVSASKLLELEIEYGLSSAKEL